MDTKHDHFTPAAYAYVG